MSPVVERSDTTGHKYPHSTAFDPSGIAARDTLMFLASLPGCGGIGTGISRPVVSLRSTTGYILRCLRHQLKTVNERGLIGIVRNNISSAMPLLLSMAAPLLMPTFQSLPSTSQICKRAHTTITLVFGNRSLADLLFPEMKPENLTPERIHAGIIK